MKLLLDTHALAWWLADSPSLSSAARSLADELPMVIRRAALPVMAISLDHAVTAASLPGPHRDPWDRLLIAQAISGELTLVSVDSVFADYGVATLW